MNDKVPRPKIIPTRTVYVGNSKTIHTIAAIIYFGLPILTIIGAIILALLC